MTPDCSRLSGRAIVREQSRAFSKANRAFGVLIACAGCSTTRPAQEISQAVQREYDIQCSSQQVEIVETRWVGRDERYLVDACGTQVELEFGLELPRTRGDRSLHSIEELPELRKGLRAFLPRSVTTLIREKVGELCAPEGSAPVPEDQFRFTYSPPVTLAMCQKRLRAALSPIGTDLVPDTQERRYWFRLDKWVFAVSPDLHAPRDSMGTPPSIVKPDARAARTSSVSATQSQDRDSLRARDGFYARLAAGAGHLSAHADEVTTPVTVFANYPGLDASAATIDLNFRLGAFVQTSIAVGAEFSRRTAFSKTDAQSDCVPALGSPCAPQRWALTSLNGFISWYPVRTAGAHLDLKAGLGWPGGYRVSQYVHTKAGLLLGTEVGYDFTLSRKTGVGVSGVLDWVPAAEYDLRVVTFGLLGSFSYY